MVVLGLFPAEVAPSPPKAPEVQTGPKIVKMEPKNNQNQKQPKWTPKNPKMIQNGSQNRPNGRGGASKWIKLPPRRPGEPPRDLKHAPSNENDAAAIGATRGTENERKPDSKGTQKRIRKTRVRPRGGRKPSLGVLVARC